MDAHSQRGELQIAEIMKERDFLIILLKMRLLQIALRLLEASVGQSSWRAVTQSGVL